uniref:Uncharacterized protein n=1 Tax=Aegilops tauschii subsp. strangulata TaxID=200361 RepID=A0A453RZB3_AEGTS
FLNLHQYFVLKDCENTFLKLTPSFFHFPLCCHHVEKMVTGLRRVSWEKVDVSFHTSMRSFAAHSIIQVKYAFMNEGADVIQHIIDHFQL